MSGRLDYAKRKRREAGQRGERITEIDTRVSIVRRRTIPGWRTAYPQEFPVTVTRIPAEEASHASD